MNVENLKIGHWYTITQSYHELRERGLIEGAQVFIKQITGDSIIVWISGTEWGINDNGLEFLPTQIRSKS